jgi:hypothetical protein
VIFDLTGPVTYDDNLQSGTDSSTLTVFLKAVIPDAKLARHMVFDKSIFHDCDIESGADGTKITVNTTRVSRFAIVPLQGPSRLLVTFVPESGSPQTASFEAGPTPN